MIRFSNHLRSLAGISFAMAMCLPCAADGDEPAGDAPPVEQKPASGSVENGKAAKLPGLRVDLKERCVDVESTVCLDQGMLEFIACTKDTKEHESIIVIEALPRHVHTALLLLGAKPGNPAMRKPIDPEGMRWIDLPPRGDLIDVFLVVPNAEGKMVEKPISEFLTASEEAEVEPEDAAFPTHTFIFAGSILHGEGPGPRKYLSDLSGNVISIATFGDEVLCLPGVHSHANGMLVWEVDGTDLPAPGSPVTLRLRPQGHGKPGQESGKAADGATPPK